MYFLLMIHKKLSYNIGLDIGYVFTQSHYTIRIHLLFSSVEESPYNKLGVEECYSSNVAVYGCTR